MVNPILSVRLAIQRRTLNVYVFVQWIEVDVLHLCSLPRHWAGNIDRFEERWNDH